MSAWSIRDIPFQKGRRVMITGATGGLGYRSAITARRPGSG